MNVVFSECSEAIKRAIDTKSYGVFYSDESKPNIEIHIHECCEILFCVSGGKSFFIGDRIYEAEDGDVFVLNQYEAHKITAAENDTFIRYVMQVHPAFIYGASSTDTDLSCCFTLRGDNITHKIPQSKEESEKLLHIFRKFSHSASVGDDILKNIAAMELLAIVNDLFSKANKDFTYRSKYDNKTIVEILKYINDNYSENLTLETIAANCYMSVNELCRLFKAHMGTTVAKYISSRRITEAKKLLKNGLSVSEAAEKCGFADYANFIRVFKKAVGIPPGQYKKRDAD